MASRKRLRPEDSGRWRFRLAPLFLLLFAAVPSVAAQPETGKRYAVLVGVKDYEHRGLAPLQYPENDVAELATLLRASGFEVTLLTGTEGAKSRKFAPTLANIEGHIGVILNRAGSQDLVLIGLAGHGMQFDKVDDSFFCPQDAVPTADAGSRGRLLSLKNLFRQMEQSRAGVKLLLVDACRNDPDPGRGRGIDGSRSPQAPQGVAALFSCSAGEKAFEHDSYKHGVFFHHVLEGLRGKAKNRKNEVTWDSLQSYVREVVPDDVKLLLNQRQLPSLNAGELRGKPPVLISQAGTVVDRAKLAIRLRPLQRSTAERLKLSQTMQPQLAFVVAGGGGDAMGLRKDDVILRINGREVPTVTEASKSMRTNKVNDRMEIEVLRNSERLKLVGRYESAFDDAEEYRRVRQRAEQGDAAAQTQLAGMCAVGRGVAKDDAEAVKWVRSAADLGDDVAQYDLGIRYTNGRGVPKDEAEAVKWYRKAAEQGYAAAQNNLGWMCETGRGVTKDEAEGIKWYRKAAEQGYSVAQTNLGWLSETGRGMAKNEAEAAKWYRKAAEDGNSRAQVNLGSLYARGRGVTKDEAEAVKWYRKAAELNNPSAHNNLGWAYEQGLGVGKDEAEAVLCYRKAAELGHALGQYNLGNCYQAGKGGLAKSEIDAASWYRKSADLGLDKAQNRLGVFYQTGRGGLEKSDSEAVKWYRKAADLGNPSAQYNLGLMYENGHGVAKSVEEAKKWYTKAAAKGDDDAKNALKRLGGK